MKTLLEEVAEILTNARAALRRHEIDRWQYLDAIRIPLKDAWLHVWGWQ